MGHYGPRAHDLTVGHFAGDDLIRRLALFHPIDHRRDSLVIIIPSGPAQ